MIIYFNLGKALSRIVRIVARQFPIASILIALGTLLPAQTDAPGTRTGSSYKEAAASGASPGVFVQQGPKLVGAAAISDPNSGPGGAVQGASVALSADGNTALVGGYGDNDGVGAIWVFTRDSQGAWSQQGAKLVASGAGTFQGYSVTLSGDGNTAMEIGSGNMVGIFSRNSTGTWRQQSNIPVAGGTVVAISGDGRTAVVGVDDAIWITTQDSSGNWSQEGTKLTGSGEMEPNQGAIQYWTPLQGSAVAISADGNTLAEGGRGDDLGVGAVWVFSRDAKGNWSQQGSKLVSSSILGAPGLPPLQGSSVALSGDGNTLLIGAPGGAPGGSIVYVRNSSGLWAQQGTVLIGSGAAQLGYPGYGQGQSVALSNDGNIALIGGADDNGSLGAVWAFARDASGNWSQLGNKLVGTGASPSGPAEAADVFQGESVALSADGNTAFVGAEGDDDGLGASWVFTRSASAPMIVSGGVVPLDSTVNTIQPGEWISIFGTNLAGATTAWTGVFTTTLGGTSVTIDGKPAYLSYVSPTQINVQAPNDSEIGPVPVVVNSAGGTASSTVTLAVFAPAFLVLDGKHVAGLIIRSNGSGAYGGGTYDILGPTGNSLGYPTVSAKAGDTVELFAVGLGPTSPPVLAGQTFSGVAPTTNSVSLLINNVSVTPSSPEYRARAYIKSISRFHLA
jgi:uncharacterized protein (TIGR03437 family)